MLVSTSVCTCWVLAGAAGVSGLVDVPGLALLTIIVAGLLGRYDWRVDLINHFRFQYMIALAVCAIGLGLLRWRKFALIALAGCVLNVFFVGPLYLPMGSRGAAQAHSIQQGRELTILHFNINTANRHTQDVAKVIRESGADIVFLQEVNPRWIAALGGQLGPYVLHTQEPRSDNFGIAMYVNPQGDSPIEVVSARAYDISGGIAQVPAIEAVVRLGAGEDNEDGQAVEVALLSVHTLPPVNGSYAAVNRKQLEAAGPMSKSGRML